MDASIKTGALLGVLNGTDLAAAVNQSNPVGVCMLAGCSSDQAALSMMTNAGVLTFGTTNHTQLGQLSDAMIATLIALANGASPKDAAAQGSEEVTKKPDCPKSDDCDPSKPADVKPFEPPHE